MFTPALNVLYVTHEEGRLVLHVKLPKVCWPGSGISISVLQSLIAVIVEVTFQVNIPMFSYHLNKDIN